MDEFTIDDIAVISAQINYPRVVASDVIGYDLNVDQNKYRIRSIDALGFKSQLLSGLFTNLLMMTIPEG